MRSFLETTTAESSAETQPAGSTGGWSFISIAFTTAILFGPIVIATGLLTGRPSSGAGLADISVLALRQSLDAGGYQLRTKMN